MCDRHQHARATHPLLGGGTVEFSGVRGRLRRPVPAFGNLVSNVVAMVASTLLANELHRRLTFQASAEVGWLHAQLEGGGLEVVGLVASSLALMALGAAIPSAGWSVQLSMLGAISGGIGLIRFVALRAWVFPAGPATDPERHGCPSATWSAGALLIVREVVEYVAHVHERMASIELLSGVRTVNPSPFGERDLVAVDLAVVDSYLVR